MTDIPTNTEPKALDPRVHELLAEIQGLGYEAFQKSISLSRWPDGTAVTETDRPLMMQAILIYEQRHVPLEQRTGFIFKGQCSSH